MDFGDDCMNKIALVTGASKGIGYTLSNMLFNMGYKVIGVYNNTLIDNKDIDAFKCDLSSEEDIIKLFNYVKDKFYESIRGKLSSAFFTY